MQERQDDKLEELLRERLPPPPPSWLARAEEMPQLERALTALEQRRADAGDADALTAALEEVGLDPDDERMRALTRLRDLRSRR